MQIRLDKLGSITECMIYVSKLITVLKYDSNFFIQKTIFIVRHSV